MHALPGGSAHASEHPAAPLAIAAALAAALVGGLLWAAVAYFTGYEVGYVAWAIGALVGFATVRAGGRGTACAGIAAALTILGILVGKTLGTHFVVQHELAKACEEAFTPAHYEELRTDAELFAALGEDPGESEVRRYVYERGYTAAETPEAIDAEELGIFTAYNVPALRNLATVGTFEEWFELRSDETRASFAREFSLASAIVEDLNPLDLVFALLAVSTAFGMIRRAIEGAVVAGPTAQDEEIRPAA